MKYNKAFIAAVYASSYLQGDEAAEAVFNKLFDVGVAAPVVLSKDQLYGKLHDVIGGCVYTSDVEAANKYAGAPSIGKANKVAWVRAFRTYSGCGLKQAFDAYEFVRDNPSILA